MASDNTTTTRLLTLLNVSATKAGKRKWAAYDDYVQPEKLNKRKNKVLKSVSVAEEVNETPVSVEGDGLNVDEEAQEANEIREDEVEDSTDPYELHFGCEPSCLSDLSKSAVNERRWKSCKIFRGKLGTTYETVPEGTDPGPSKKPENILERIKKPFLERQKRLPNDQAELQNDVLSVLAGHQDLYIVPSPWETKRCIREAISLHAVNHVTKKRRRVLKNNERLAHAAKTGIEPPEDVQDQGFTRPSILILLPFRSSGLEWFKALTSHTPSPEFQIENQNRFLAEYGLPPDAVDKLASAAPGTYPLDHTETFKGNVDDSFRVGIKLTRKSVKMFTDFYGCDIILASPLGLRQSIQKEKNADYLSSIEVLVIDQLDALTMQNWEHVKFVMEHLNKLPKESHDTDFSRTKPWYLDGQAEYLRQSVLLSAYETPETRALYNSSLKNVAGKVRLDHRWSPIDVPEGIEQNFVRFDCASPKDEADKRFSYFTTQLLPVVLKSAVQSANTLIFIPSYFDFVRVHNYFRTLSGVTFTVLSEYSTNQDISRARQAFFAGNKSFLLMTERFHFYKRYKIRGIRNLIFYGPPDHPQFYSELLSYPFLDDGVESSDITCRVLYSKYDWFRLERIAGTEASVELVKSL
ncbi:digestive organ expansion factor [Dendrothele bispora CBS 962.96]|uniref:U3 small nucleolar RNA-associated protein 25 n=1 Tax=Dendrothele bispora (strain CBS 962.96) TaxID=1314807 RepID=A0A4S8M3P5_DENBC|nr:digestive organ expansion factor [Dendrothele bispora CBS 962.96]